MIDKLTLHAFKSYKDIEITFKPLTLFSGLNSTGKSSIIQALRMFNQAGENLSPLLKGHGSVSDIRSNFVAPNEEIEIICSISIDGINADDYKLVLTDSSIIQPKKSPLYFYISADRLGPQALLPLNSSFTQTPQFGEQGEYVLDVLDHFKYSLIPESLKHPDAEGRTLEYVLRAWLGEISPGVKFAFSTDNSTDSANAEIDGFRPTNVGFGLSYTLPVLVAILAMAAEAPADGWNEHWGERWSERRLSGGAMVIVENPEAHLHPQGQTAMGRLLALAASVGVQVVVETHSDHLMDGIRLAVKEELVDANDVAFHYLSKNEEGVSSIASPQLHSNGKLDFWPEGFFDQTLKNRAMLAKRG